MKKYFLLSLALLLGTAPATARVSKLSRISKFLGKTTLGSVTGLGATMAATEKCPVQDAAPNALTPAMTRASIIIGSTVATKIPGAITSILALTIYDHQKQIAQAIKTLQDLKPSKMVTGNTTSEPDQEKEKPQE